jgi:acyl-CoA dehydrogenase
MATSTNRSVMADQTRTRTTIPNRVLTGDARTSKNFYTSDRILRHYLEKHLDGNALKYLKPKLHRLGAAAATVMDKLSLEADKNGPELVKRSPFGEPAETVKFHPAYRQMLDIAIESEMIHVKYESSLKVKFAGKRHRMGFAAGQLFAMSEMGLYCPLCMTDGAAYVLERHAGKELRNRLIPYLSSNSIEDLYTGAMFLTEKSGGSDVGRNQTTAVKIDGKKYKLNGEKWFCSNVNADVMLVLARTGREEEGTRGLSLFVVEKYLDDGSRNPMEIVRLKEKLGVRSMATAEVLLTDTTGTRLGEEGNGFKIMTDMVNMSRLYNALTAVAAARRALIEVWQYLNHRVVFDKKAVEHPLIREKFHELGSLHVANFHLVWRTIESLDRLEAGQKKERDAYRMLVPMAKWWSAETAVYVVRECMELMGGNGYIEDFILPKLMRDVNVLPIWEGSGNIIVLDILRALDKTDALEQLTEEMQSSFTHEGSGPEIRKQTEEILELLSQAADAGRDQLEATAKPLFRRFIHLYQMYLMIRDLDEESKQWLEPALAFMRNQHNSKLRVRKPMSMAGIRKLIGWEY